MLHSCVCLCVCVGCVCVREQDVRPDVRQCQLLTLPRGPPNRPASSPAATRQVLPGRSGWKRAGNWCAQQWSADARRNCWNQPQPSSPEGKTSHFISVCLCMQLCRLRLGFQLPSRSVNLQCCPNGTLTFIWMPQQLQKYNVHHKPPGNGKLLFSLIFPYPIHSVLTVDSPIWSKLFQIFVIFLPTYDLKQQSLWINNDLKLHCMNTLFD